MNRDENNQPTNYDKAQRLNTAMRAEANALIAKYTAGALTTYDLAEELMRLDAEYAYCDFCDDAKKILSTFTTPGPDPTAALRLECGHTVI